MRTCCCLLSNVLRFVNAAIPSRLRTYSKKSSDKRPEGMFITVCSITECVLRPAAFELPGAKRWMRGEWKEKKNMGTRKYTPRLFGSVFLGIFRGENRTRPTRRACRKIAFRRIPLPSVLWRDRRNMNIFNYYVGIRYICTRRKKNRIYLRRYWIRLCLFCTYGARDM